MIICILTILRTDSIVTSISVQVYVPPNKLLPKASCSERSPLFVDSIHGALCTGKLSSTENIIIVFGVISVADKKLFG